MYHLGALLAPVLALLPVAVVPGAGPDGADDAGMTEMVGLPADAAPTAAGDDAVDGFAEIVRALRSQKAHQVRIEQRVMIRIAPAPIARPGPPLRRGMPDFRRDMFADLPDRGGPPRLAERRMAQCVPVAGISGVQVTRDSKLLLFMRDQKIVSAALEKTCNPRDFYSGFYLERSSDGQLCSGRDTLHSRSGADCALGKLRQLVEVDDDD